MAYGGLAYRGYAGLLLLQPMLLMLPTLLVASSMLRMSLVTSTMATLTSPPTLMLWEIRMEEFLVDTLMLMPTENFSRFNMLLMEQNLV